MITVTWIDRPSSYSVWSYIGEFRYTLLLVTLCSTLMHCYANIRIGVVAKNRYILSDLQQYAKFQK
jgi:hypothetical protein